MRNTLLVVKIALSVAALWWILHLLNPAQLREAFSRFDAATIAAAAAFFVVQALVMGWRWHRIVRLLGGPLSPWRAIKWVFVGLFFNQALPSSVGGDVVRVWLLHRDGAPRGVAFASVVAERGTGVVIVGLLVSLCMPAVWGGMNGAALRYTLLAIGPALLLALLGVAFQGHRMASVVPGAAGSALASLAGALRQVVLRPAAALELGLLGALSALAGYGAAWLLGQRLGIEAGLPVYVVLVGGAVLLGVLPISLGGWGVREVGMVALFGSIGVRAEDALALSIAYGVLPLVVSLPGGFAWWRTSGAPSREELGRT